MFDMREHEWKPWRAVFSRAFSAEHIMLLVPDMVDETMVYSETLRKLAKQAELFHLDLTTLRFTIDVIGKTILYVDTILSSPRATVNTTKKQCTPWGSKRVQRFSRLHAESNPLASSERRG